MHTKQDATSLAIKGSPQTVGQGKNMGNTFVRVTNARGAIFKVSTFGIK
jgi:hypothetical protein